MMILQRSRKAIVTFTTNDGKGKDTSLSEKMLAYWVNFARTGNLNGPNPPAWPVYRSETDSNLEFSDTIRANQNLYKNECDFISRRLE